MILAHALKREHFKVGMNMDKQYEIQGFVRWLHKQPIAGIKYKA